MRGALPHRPISDAETLHVSVVSVAFVGEPAPGAVLGLAVAARGVLRGPGARCAETMLLFGSKEERPFEMWDADDQHELEAEIRGQISSAGPRLLAELLDRSGRATHDGDHP
jgi:hypothetical protein